MKNTLPLIIIVVFITLASCIFFFDKSTTDRVLDNSVNYNASAIDNLANEEANASFESDTENPSSSSNLTDISDSMQTFNYGECFSYEPEVERKLGEKHENYLDTLRNSSIKDEQIALAIFDNMVFTLPSELQEENRQKIDALLELDLIEDPLIALEILHTCNVHSNYERCNNELIDMLTSQHKNDSEVWFRVLEYYVKTGQDELIFNAIEQLKQSKYASSYSHLYINAYIQTMEKASIGNYNSSVTRALLYYNFAKLPSHTESTAWCRDNLDKEKYAQGCLELATMLEQKSHDKYSRLVGLAFQNLVYSAEGNTDLVKIVQQRKGELSPKYLSDDWKKHTDVSKTVFRYEKLLRAYIANTAILGERGAFKPLEDEVETFRASGQYADCGEF